MASKDEIYASPRELTIGLAALTVLGCIAITRDRPPFRQLPIPQHIAAAPNVAEDELGIDAGADTLAGQRETPRTFEIARSR